MPLQIHVRYLLLCGSSIFLMLNLNTNTEYYRINSVVKDTDSNVGYKHMLARNTQGSEPQPRNPALQDSASAQDANTPTISHTTANDRPSDVESGGFEMIDGKARGTVAGSVAGTSSSTDSLARGSAKVIDDHLKITQQGTPSDGQHKQSTGPQQPPRNAIHTTEANKSDKTLSEQAVKSPRQKAAPNGIKVIPNSETFIRSVFLDRRLSQVYLRLFGIQNRTQIQSEHLACEMLLNDGSYVRLADESSYPVYPAWPSTRLIYQGYYYGFIIPDDVMSALPKNIPGLVKCYLTSRPSDSLLLEYALSDAPADDARDLAICVRATWGHIDPLRLIEWFEFNRLVGVSKFVFYTRGLANDTLQILESYKRAGLLDIVEAGFNDYLWDSYIQHDPIAKSLRDSDWLMEQVYIVNTNECLYEYSAKFKAIIVLDLDELIIPSDVNKDLIDVMNQLKKQHPNGAGFNIAPAWHFDEFGPVLSNSNNSKSSTHLSNKTLPSITSVVARNGTALPLHTLRYLKRTPVMRSQPKSIIISAKFVSANMHSIISVQKGHGFSTNYYIDDQSLCYLHHYRYRCKYDAATCAQLIAQPVTDDVIPKYARKLVNSVTSAINTLRQDGVEVF